MEQPKQFGRWRALTSKYMHTATELFRLYGKQIATGVFFLLIYFFLAPFVNPLLSKYWVTPVVEPFQPRWYFTLGFFCIACLLFYSFRFKRIAGWDWLILFLYLYLRLENKDWVFRSVFSQSYGNPIDLWYLDIVGLYYLYRISLFILRYRQSVLRKRNSPKLEPDLLHTDMPLRLQSEKFGTALGDLDAEGLNRNKFAKDIASVMMRILPYQAFAIGICGAWGSGKTSLIALIVEQLKDQYKKTTNNKREYVFIDFVPWFFTGSEALVASIFGKIEAAFAEDFPLAAEIKSYGRTIASMEKAFMHTELSSELFSANKDLEHRYEQISGRIREKNKILVISIDDLDRLDSKEVVDVLRLIRLVANFPHTFYLVGYDRDYVNQAIKDQLTKHEPDKYLDKIFNLEFKIPHTNADIIRERLEKALRSQFSLLHNNKSTISENQLSQSIKYPMLVHIIRTERDILRFCNNLMIRHLSIRQDINFYHLFLLELLAYQQAPLVGELFLAKESILAEHERVRRNTNSVEGFNLESILGHKKFTPLSENIIKLLFSKASFQEDFSIASRDYFTRYFSLSLEAGEFSEAAFLEATQLPTEEFGTVLKSFYAQNPEILADKLVKHFNGKEITDEVLLDKLIRALLILYVEVFPSENERLQRVSLGVMIVQLLINGDAAPSYLSLRSLETPSANNAAMRFLFSCAFLNDILAKEQSVDVLVYFPEFRNTQLQLLEREIAAVNRSYSPTIIVQIQHLYDFYDSLPTVDNYNWHMERVIRHNRDWFIHNWQGIYDWVIQKASVSGQLDVVAVKNTLATLMLNLNDPYYEDRDWHRFHTLNQGYVSINHENFHFQLAAIKDIPEYNDQYSDNKSAFEMHEGDALLVNLNPGTTPVWRFGFRLSIIKEFPKTERYISQYLMIELVKGKIEPNNPSQDDPMERLDLALKLGKETKYNDILLPEYDNDSLLVRLARVRDKFIVTIEDERGEAIKTVSFDGYAEFRFAQLTVWADKRNFDIYAAVEILKRPSVTVVTRS